MEQKHESKPVKIEISGSLAEDVCTVVKALACLLVAILSALVEIIQELKKVMIRHFKRW
jgi:hypothetical protein